MKKHDEAHHERMRIMAARPSAQQSGKGSGSEKGVSQGSMDSITRLKRKIQKSLALIDYYDDLSSRKISDVEEMEGIKSKMAFTQKEILKLCLESKKMIKDIEQKSINNRGNGSRTQNEH